jgi:predicted MFS family arabinose efflux permease
MAAQARILKSRFFLANVALSVLVFTAMFTGYTYLAEMLEKSAGIAPAQVGWWLMGFGRLAWSATGWAGCGSIEAARHHRLFCAILALGMAGSMLLSQAGWVFALALAVWGIANTALYPICQIRVMKAASGAQALAGTLNVSAANGGIALGAAVGGAALSSWGAGQVGYLAAGIALLAVLMAAMVAKLSPR